jgi:hypothetical protein
VVTQLSDESNVTMVLEMVDSQGLDIST